VVRWMTEARRSWFAQGDHFQTQANYTEGALRYLFQTPNSNWGKNDSGQQAYGVLSDAVYGSGTGNTTVHCGFNGGGCLGLNRTTGWSVNAAFEHTGRRPSALSSALPLSAELAGSAFKIIHINLPQDRAIIREFKGAILINAFSPS